MRNRLTTLFLVPTIGVLMALSSVVPARAASTHSEVHTKTICLQGKDSYGTCYGPLNVNVRAFYRATSSGSTGVWLTKFCVSASGEGGPYADRVYDGYFHTDNDKRDGGTDESVGHLFGSHDLAGSAHYWCRKTSQGARKTNRIHFQVRFRVGIKEYPDKKEQFDMALCREADC